MPRLRKSGSLAAVPFSVREERGQEARRPLEGRRPFRCPCSEQEVRWGPSVGQAQESLASRGSRSAGGAGTSWDRRRGRRATSPRPPI
ncbi:Hypothetical predicted protein [Lynx pardinus]|uniref:Uncharacterized protein n=1 Tax=Lynx pardinus TaxID=191816 RepID=A0A485P513_LYNPA|nr:Hypothetical predicted protein [Lynx pardinus]